MVDPDESDDWIHFSNGVQEYKAADDASGLHWEFYSAKAGKTLCRPMVVLKTGETITIAAARRMLNVESVPPGTRNLNH